MTAGACGKALALSRRLSCRRQGFAPSRGVACSAGADQQPSHADSHDWLHSMPSYMQSTVQTDICDTWSDAISEAEAEAAAREKARREGRDPDAAAEMMRAELRDQRTELVWSTIRQEAATDIEQEPMLSSFLYASILAHKTFHEALSFVLSNRLADQTMLPTQLFSLFESLFKGDPDIIRSSIADLQAVYDRDPACISYSCALLYFKGYQAIQIQRLAHALWHQGRRVMALSLQSRMSEVLGLDIHPAATFGKGILLDHGTGVVIGETAVIGNGVSLMQNVTLGGTGKEVGDRHPKIRDHVLIGAGAAVLGNIVVGTGAQIVAGSLVLKPVDAHTMVAGSPAKPVGPVRGNPALQMEQWNKMLFDNGRLDLRRTLGGDIKQGHASAEDAIFGTGSSAPTPASRSDIAAAADVPDLSLDKGVENVVPVADDPPPAPSAAERPPPPEASSRAEGAANARPPTPASPAVNSTAAQARMNYGVLESISAAEHRGRNARIEKKRELIKGTRPARPTADTPIMARHSTSGQPSASNVFNGARPVQHAAPSTPSQNGARSYPAAKAADEASQSSMPPRAAAQAPTPAPTVAAPPAVPGQSGRPFASAPAEDDVNKGAAATGAPAEGAASESADVAQSDSRSKSTPSEAAPQRQPELLYYEI